MSCDHKVFFLSLVSLSFSLSHTAYYGDRKLPKKKVLFGNFLPGTFANPTFCVRSLWVGGQEKFSSLVHTENISPSTSKSYRVFWSSDTKNCWSRQEDAVFDISPPRARIAVLLRSM